ncbi:hypothetical protein EYF80_013454 [Liparis tanakae]|uniref:Uncharacterized protein n=1 Tax=Liparis tanakae TaxID=230148 RepID=A0A4Z2IFJ3_9TELE|nr:hypothetical protein EYF80_013454 [Liparis tanakae]
MTKEERIKRPSDTHPGTAALSWHLLDTAPPRSSVEAESQELRSAGTELVEMQAVSYSRK